MSKYNDFMSHIRVDDAMHRRIMSAVSEAVDQRAEVSPLNSEKGKVQTPIKRRAKVSVIKIISIAAAAVLVVGGAIMLSTKTMNSSTRNLVQEGKETLATEIDSALRVDGHNKHFSGNKKSLTGNSMTKSAAEPDRSYDDKAFEDEKEEGATEAGEPGQNRGDIKDSLPFKIKAVGTGSFKDNIIMTVYAGDDGEKMILFKAPEGTDIIKAYYPDFQGIPALLQTEAGQVFKAVDTAAGRNEQVKNAGPFDAVTWTKDGTCYMLAFSSKKETTVFISIMEKV